MNTVDLDKINPQYGSTSAGTRNASIILWQSFVLWVSEKVVLVVLSTVSAQTFGCQMNARDSEKITGILEAVGYEITESVKADFIVYNTCTVRENANLKVYGHLGLMGHEKKKNPDMMIALWAV